jgi:hypothetical protein
MVGNAVPPYLGYYLAKSIIEALNGTVKTTTNSHTNKLDMKYYEQYPLLNVDNIYCLSQNDKV